MSIYIEILKDRLYQLECDRNKQVEIAKRKLLNARISEIRWILKIIEG